MIVVEIMFILFACYGAISFGLDIGKLIRRKSGGTGK